MVMVMVMVASSGLGPWDGVKSIRDDISRNCHVNVGDSLGSIRTLTVTPCVEVVAVWTVPGAVSPGCILAEPRRR